MYSQTAAFSAPLSLVQQVRAHDYRRFLAIQRAPAEARPALYALTAFNHEIASIAELVSEPMVGAIRLAWWREAVEELAAGKPPRAHPVVEGLAYLLRDTPILADDLLAMIVSREADLDPAHPASVDIFLAYLDATAGALHLLWAHVLGADDSTHVSITSLSRAYAILGLLRAIPALSAEGQCRLPRDLLEQHDLTADSTGHPSDSLRALAFDLHQRATYHLTQTKSLPKPHLALRAIARHDGAALQKATYDPFNALLIHEARLGLVWRVFCS